MELSSSYISKKKSPGYAWLPVKAEPNFHVLTFSGRRIISKQYKYWEKKLIPLLFLKQCSIKLWKGFIGCICLRWQWLSSRILFGEVICNCRVLTHLGQGYENICVGCSARGSVWQVTEMSHIKRETYGSKMVASKYYGQWKSSCGSACPCDKRTNQWYWIIQDLVFKSFWMCNSLCKNPLHCRAVFSSLAFKTMLDLVWSHCLFLPQCLTS